MSDSSVRTFFNKYIYTYLREIKSGERRFVIIPAVLFSVFMVVGHSYSEIDSWDLVFGAGSVQFLKACVRLALYFVLFYYVICLLYHKFNTIFSSSERTMNEDIREETKKHLFGRYINLLSRYPFRTSFLTIFVIYIPYMIISYPGIIMTDTLHEILQSYSQLRIIVPDYLYGHRLSDQVYLNNHHPIAHTLLLHAFLQIGNVLFHSFNAGVFLFALLQFCALLSAVSYGIKILVEKTAFPDKYVPLIILYYVAFARIQNYMFLLTKDVVYTVFVFYFTLFLYLIIIKPERRYYILFTVSGLGMILLRHEAKYILMISLPVMALLCRQLRKFFLKYLVGVIGFSILYFQVLLPVCHITPGSIREVLSVPFQQTARYILEYEADVTAEERDAIDAVLDYDHLVEYYYPHLSDFVKSTYKEDCTRADLLRYFRVWFQMFWKHPDAYIQATINNYFYYFYPGPIVFQIYTYSGSTINMSLLNQAMESLGADFHYPSNLDRAREQYERTREGIIMYIPPFVLLTYSPTYTWTLILLLMYGIYKKIPRALGLLVVPVLVLCMCLVSPCNGFYFRYLYPIIFIFPVLLPLYFSLRNK